jgi:hypothetical protein
MDDQDLSGQNQPRQGRKYPAQARLRLAREGGPHALLPWSSGLRAALLLLGHVLKSAARAAGPRSRSLLLGRPASERLAAGLLFSGRAK